MERRLAAIFAADVVGYSRLMGVDEAGTLERLKALRNKVVHPSIVAHKGRVVKIMGDGLLAEFPSVIEAVQCAIEVQEAIATRAEDELEEQRIRLRVGVNLGDLIVEGDDIYGDGVNVAARLEGLAEPGGLCISGKVYEEIKNRVPVAFDDLGDQDIKNIREPVRIYRWTVGSAAAESRSVGYASGLSRSEKPSIAILPFANMSGDPEQEYFSDGITEDIITELARFRELHVIARHSTFYFKGKAARVRDVGDSLKVEYVLEGSVRKSGDRIRITAQLIDTTSEAHIWADRYDRNVDDVFEVQDEVTRSIISIVAGQVQQFSKRRATKIPTSTRAYDYVLRGQAIISESAEANRQAREMYEKAVSLDPSCARAHAGVAGALLLDWMSGWGDPQNDSLELALSRARQALALDDADLRTRWELGKILMFRREFEQAEFHLKKALDLNPNDTDGMAVLAMLLIYSGKSEEAVRRLSDAKMLNPFQPAWHQWFLGFAQFTARHYKEAITTLSEAIETGPKFVTPHRHLAASYAQLDELDLARAEVRQILELDPGFNLDRLLPLLPFKRDEDLQHYLNALIKAGLPR